MGSYFSTESRLHTGFRKEDNNDMLGDEGRKVLNACVKVKTYGKPETRKYGSERALQLFDDCYAELVGEADQEFLQYDSNNKEKTYSVVDIYNAMVKYDDMPYVRIYPKEGPGSEKMRELIDQRRADVERELEEAIANPDGKKMYSWTVAQRRVRDCYAGNFPGDVFMSELSFKKILSIKDIENAVGIFDEKSIEIFSNQTKITDEKVLAHRACGEDIRLLQLCKYPAEGPGSKELRESIARHRADLQKEKPDHEYSREEAERCVRDCFASGFPGDREDLFPIKKDESGMPKIYQTYDIFDIKKSLDYFDSKKFLEKYPEEGDIFKEYVDEGRAHILSEYKIATAHVEIEHGSGFLISNHFILTNKHVIETYLNEKGFEICICNAAIDELHCEVAHTDPGKDLALLYCPALNLPQSKISPLQLSTQPLLPGMQIFSFGYPVSHTEETALFVAGNVSGSKRTLSGHSKVVLNCALNSGNSGGPVLSWVDGQVKVVAIATQKHFKEILTFDEIATIENIRKSLQTRTITDVSESEIKRLSDERAVHIVPGSIQVSNYLLTLKLYDALETHSQFNLSNALPGDLVVGFIKDSIHKYKGEHKEELFKVIELSQ